MDKNTITGMLLILAVVVGFSIWNRPTPEQIAARNRYQDSIQMVQKMRENELKNRDEIRSASVFEDTDSDSIKEFRKGHLQAVCDANLDKICHISNIWVNFYQYIESKDNIFYTEHKNQIVYLIIHSYSFSKYLVQDVA